ncbi:MAG: serine/threonine-protein phosphatase, partial [Erysipelotrichaceae bacterium]|nr:serine/threonine-protein phosphatase [Erysipelotrichaceae bacterium]
FYDFFMIDENHLGVVIADVSGKGVPAALFMMISKTIVQNFAMLGISVAEVLENANEALCAQNKMEMFVTTWLGILEISTGKMTCASAGHEYPAIYRDGRFTLFKDKHGFVLGGMEGAKYKEYELQFKKGDKIFVYTDGVPEATNENHELFGTDRMIDALNRVPEADPKEILKNVRASVDAFVGTAEQFDDLTMLCLEYRGSED